MPDAGRIISQSLRQIRRVSDNITDSRYPEARAARLYCSVHIVENGDTLGLYMTSYGTRTATVIVISEHRVNTVRGVECVQKLGARLGIFGASPSASP